MKPITPETVDLAYRMCGRRAIDAEFTADVFNLLLKKGTQMTLSDSTEIAFKHEQKVQFRGMSQGLRTFLKYGRNLR